MREILFRGKADGGCCWVYGHYAVLNDGYRPDWKRHYILSGELRYNDQYGAEDIRKVEIDPKTLGQYTGLKDKNGKRIFEGDIVRARLEEGVHAGFEWPLMRIEYRDAAFTLVDKLGRAFCTMAALAPNVGLEVLGNVHDDPELMGGANDEKA